MRTSNIGIAAIALLALQPCFAQPPVGCDPPSTRARIIINDNGSGVDTLWFGFDISARYMIDQPLCEWEIPPAPPTGVFDARFVNIPGREGWDAGQGLGQGTKQDYRPYEGRADIDTHKIRFSPGDVGYPVTLRWYVDRIIAICDSAVIRDEFGGVIVRARMDQVDSVRVTNPAISFLLLIRYGAILYPASAGWEKLNTGTWTRLNCVTVHHSSANGKMWACGDDGVILYSSNGGDVWMPQVSGTSANLYTITFKEVAGGPVFAAGANGVILRTTNDGATWNPIPSGTTATLRDHSDFGWIIVGDSGVVLHSTDSGLSWALRESGTTANLHSVSGAFTTYAVGEAGTVIRSHNDGHTWQILETGMDERLLGVPMFGAVNYAVGSGGLIMKSTTSGEPWSPLPSGTNAALRSIEFSTNNTSRLYAVGDGGVILKTTDDGATWGRQESPTRANLRSVFFYLNDDIGYACGDSGTILRTTDGGGGISPTPDSWEDMFPLFVGNQWEYEYNWFYNDAFNWTAAQFTGTAQLAVIGVTHNDEFTTWFLREDTEGTYCIDYASGGSDTCYTRRDSALFELIEQHSWRHRLYRNEPAYTCWNSLVPMGVDLVEPSFIYRYAYPDSGSTVRVRAWEDPIHPAIVYDILMKADSGLAGIDSRVAYLVPDYFGSNHRLISGAITSTPGGNATARPTAYILFQNYPNPFNPRTTIVYEVKSRESVSLRVVDVLGREVATLVNEVREPGMHETEWNAGDLASGVYFYQLNAGGFISTRKLILLR